MKHTGASPIPSGVSRGLSAGLGNILSRSSYRLALLLALLGLVVIARENSLGDSIGHRLQTFVTIFLSIFIEAAPFLLAGSVVSGFIDVFINRDTLYRFVPGNSVLAAFAGAGMGLVFPVCECGVVPVTRKLYQKGLPTSMGIAFLLAAPVINPIVIASTYAAFGWGPILIGRIGLTFLIASLIGLLFYFAPPEEVLRAEATEGGGHHHDHPHEHPEAGKRTLWDALATAGDDFLDMSRYLIVGSMLAAGMQTLVPQPVLLALGGGAISSILAMMLLAFVLSICSTVDAFLALAFANTFTPASILAFLVFGPMVDIKSALMFLSVFKRRTVLYLILLPLLVTLFIAVYLNLNVSW
jgi:uncharacterized protein